MTEEEKTQEEKILKYLPKMQDGSHTKIIAEIKRIRERKRNIFQGRLKV